MHCKKVQNETFCLVKKAIFSQFFGLLFPDMSLYLIVFQILTLLDYFDLFVLLICVFDFDDNLIIHDNNYNFLL